MADAYASDTEDDTEADIFASAFGDDPTSSVVRETAFKAKRPYLAAERHRAEKETFWALPGF
jgi:hypothetical protein